MSFSSSCLSEAVCTEPGTLNRASTALAKYLSRYAEPEATDLQLFDRHYDYSLVIPAFQEEANQIYRVWQSIPESTSFLVILIVNARSAPDKSALTLVEELGRHHTRIEVACGKSLLKLPSGPDLLLIDRYSSDRTIPEKQGVDLARKIGCDIALQLFVSGQVLSNWLFTTDADAILPGDYFDMAADVDDVACIFPFRHTADDDLDLAVRLYEIYLLYYAAGLRWAGSPYGFTTVGSTITCRADAYAAVRGYPKRSTGEDFYLLNKIRKLGNVRSLSGPAIELDGRISTRVPVGTGQAVAGISALKDPVTEYRYEHPECFEILREFLLFLRQLSDKQPEYLQTGDTDTQAYCEKSGLTTLYLDKRRENPSPQVMLKFLMDWFDGLKTRQFIHHLRDHHYGTVSVSELTNSPLINITWQSESSLDDISADLSGAIQR